MTTDAPVRDLSEEDAMLILFAGVARSRYYNGLAGPPDLFGYCRRGIRMKWLPEELREHAQTHWDNPTKLFLTLESLRESGLLMSTGAGYAITPEGAAAVEKLLYGKGYTLDHLTYYVGR